MKVWITGSNGFLGYRLAKKLTSCGHEVLGLARRPTSTPWSSCAIDLACKSAYGYLQRLLRDSGTPDVVIHTASRQPGVNRFSDYAESNVLATATLLDALADSPPYRIVYTSTLSVYGQPERSPVLETDMCRGTSPYAVTKRCCEQLLEAFTAKTLVVILRIPSMFGVGQADSFVDGLARLVAKGEPLQLLARGETIRDTLSVCSVVKAIEASLFCLFEEKCCYLNLGCGQPTTVRDYAELLVSEFKSASQIVPVDRRSVQPSLYADISKAQRVLGFYPPSLREAIRLYAAELSS